MNKSDIVIEIAPISEENLTWGVSASDLVGIDIEASMEAYDELLLKAVREEYPNTHLSLNYNTLVFAGDDPNSPEAHAALQFVADEAERIYNRGEFWKENG